MTQPHVTAIVNLHREGRRCEPSILSAIAALGRATQAGIETELLLVLDRADDATTAIAADLGAEASARLVHVDFGDLGLARNSGVDHARGNYIAFLDGDDLWGDEWLLRAHQMISTVQGRVVLHPELSLVHGAAVRAVKHPDSNDATFDHGRFRLHNSWTALSFASRDLFLDVPFPKNRLHAGFGFEDWSWNAEVLRRGIDHRTVPHTCHVIALADDDSSLKARSRTAVRSEWSRP